MTREEAYALLTKYLKNPNLLKHSLAAEAAMKALYFRLVPPGEQHYTVEEKWGITGLLHDVDYEMAKDHPEKHGLMIFDKEPGKIPDDIAYAIKAHNYQRTNVLPKSTMDWAIVCCDQLTGLIVASALIHPDKKLASIDADFVLKRMGEKSFAKGADRHSIKLCDEKLTMSLEEFVTITLKAMQKISKELEL